jgi:hypothetical protein
MLVLALFKNKEGGGRLDGTTALVTKFFGSYPKTRIVKYPAFRGFYNSLAIVRDLIHAVTASFSS